MYGSTIVSDKVRQLLGALRSPMRAALMSCFGAGFVFLAIASIQLQEVVTPQIDRIADSLNGAHFRLPSLKAGIGA
ncbi:MAG: hypothetical protein WDM79_11800 [Terricaulis sp.]